MVDKGEPCVNLLEKLNRWANETPDRKAWTFLNDKGDIADSYSFKELEVATDALAEFLLNQQKLKKGDRVMLVFFPGLDFSAALLACFKAELIAVPVFPPDPRRLKKDLHHFVSIQKSSEAAVALTNGQYNFLKKVEDIKNIFSGERWPDLKWILVDDQLKKAKSGNKVLQKTSFPSPDVIAFLQYTSGSTSEPKGVMISHLNLAHNLTLIIRELAADQSTRNLSWLPQYHDMGLIGSYLGVIYCGGEGFYLSPISFLKDPLLWVRAMSRFKATHTQAPNFAYALVARKYNETERFKPGQEPNLSNLKHAINAAEPVDYFAIMGFYEIFIKYGIRKDVIFPTYGLAEHTVFVCSGGRQVLIVKKTALERGTIEIIGEEELKFKEMEDSFFPDDSQRIVGCGYPGKNNDVEVLIVNPDTQKKVGELSIGEVWVDSFSKAQGYWNHPEQSKHDFQAELLDDDIEKEGKEEEDKLIEEGKEGIIEKENYPKKTYLRTGDLGFMYKNELFICGRLKDLIIIGGTNHYPQDIERTIERGLADQLRPGCSACFSLHPTDKKGEEIIYVAEVKEGVQPSQYDYIVQLCRELAAMEHGVGLKTICLLETRTVPKTTSGKIARAWCRKAFIEKKLSIIYRSDAEYSEYQGDFSVTSNPGPGVGEVNGDTTPRAAGGYSKVPTQDDAKSANSNVIKVRSANINPSAAAVIPTAHEETPMMNRIESKLGVEELRGLSVEQIKQRLENSLIQVSSVGPSKLSAPLDENVPLTSYGLDSMTIVQFKGVLENRYYCDIPDEFVFSNLATLSELAKAVKIGHLTADQKHRFEHIASATHQLPPGEQANSNGNPQNKNNARGPPDYSNVVAAPPRQPLCPWFTCCY